MKRSYSNLFRMLSLLLLFLITSIVKGQDITVSGTVKSTTTNEVLPGVNILIKGTNTGTVTDIDGNYSIVVPDEDAILVFSFIGHIEEEVPVGSKTAIDVSLVEDIMSLDELVVIGYGTQRKGDVTSSVAQVKSDDFVKGAVQDVGQLVQGKVAGLTISSTNADPTGNTEIHLRGNNSFYGTNQAPLILIDGIPGDFNSVASEDIETIDVLKDGSAAAIYGTQGSNGVIIITTKRATGQYSNRVSYSGYVTTQTIAKQLDMMDASEFRQAISNGYIGESYDVSDGVSSTDWQSQVMRTPISHVHNLTAQGGNLSTNYLLNVNFRDLEGYFRKSDNQKTNVKLDINQSLFDGLIKLNAGTIIRQQKFTCTGDGASFNSDIYRQSIIYNPTAPVYNEDGTYYENTGILSYCNPEALINETDGMIDSQWDRYYGSAILSPIENLNFKALFSYSKYNESRGYYETTNHISTTRDGKNGWGSDGTKLTRDRLLELTGDYSLEKGPHKIGIMGGYSYKDYYLREFWMQNCDFPTDEFSYHELELGAGLTEGSQYASIGGSTATTNLIAFFGRATYSLFDKYLLMGSLRYEGASELYGSEDQWGWFPSVSAGWKISEESFMQSLDFITNLKLRVGYGVTGTQPSAGFLAVGTMNYTSGGYFYSDGEWIRTIQYSSNDNPNLRWEEKSETNIGIDFGLFNHRISGAIDYYMRRVDGLLLDFAVPVPPNVYSTTTANVGIMDNSGLEVLINADVLDVSDFSWNTSVTFSTNKNEVVSIDNELYENESGYFTWGAGNLPEPLTSIYTHRVEVGQPVGNFYGFKVVGAYTDDEGRARWIYENADGEQVNSEDFAGDDADKQVLGNGIPKFNLSWGNTFTYKNIDLSVGMRGAFGFQILNVPRMFLENPSMQYQNRLNSAFDDVYGAGVLSEDEAVEYNSYYVEDGDYWKIDNITLGYNFDIKESKYIHSARLYASCLNTLTITGYKGLDPEISSSDLDPGVDSFYSYPNARTFTIGVDVKF